MRWMLDIMCIVALILLFSSPVSSESSILKVDYYYNDQFIPVTTTPEPYLKIGEPLTLAFNVTCYKECNLSVALLSSSYDIIEGPTSNFGDRVCQVMSENETKFFEWIVAANDNSSGSTGSISFRYDMTDLNRGYKITGGGPVILYAKISHLHYDGPKIEKVSSEASSSNEGRSPTTPAFTALCAVFALVVMSLYRRM
ncbi:sarcinarray family MAST domain-containing protein [Methanolobus profundi]|uniref:Sarcinarray family protein n=1 Tax=Methanolobus profundi TaxID=487685 RepID=A0A1I4NNK3_9EURY|nr:sarcinarray family MAST domain-containing protein [Methanolobus profundi]SFM16920.1 sarcinarray family protein [Methanolobus profundi]